MNQNITNMAVINNVTLTNYNMQNNNIKIEYSPEFGYSVYGKTIGEAWMTAVKCVLENGVSEPDESRERIALQSFRLKSETQVTSDPIIKAYAKNENVQAMIDLVFNKDVMKDFDVTPSFRVGAKSYKKRLEEGKMLDFVINRLAGIPESKKAVMVFPTYEDYAQVTNAPLNDYLPCIVSMQFRLRPAEDGVQKLNTIVNMRSWNIDQKGAGDLTVFTMLTKVVAEALSNKLMTKVVPGTIDTMITDVHIYKNTIEAAKNIVAQFNK